MQLNDVPKAISKNSAAPLLEIGVKREEEFIF
jgi:hypothetical protein